MGTKQSRSYKELTRAVDEVLHYLWDPIGVAGAPGARDEYQLYLPQVIGLLLKGSTRESIADYLGSVRTIQMGLRADATHDATVASILVEWNEVIQARADKLSPQLPGSD